MKGLNLLNERFCSEPVRALIPLSTQKRSAWCDMKKQQLDFQPELPFQMKRYIAVWLVTVELMLTDVLL